MSTYLIHPLLLGSKDFDKSMMTYQHGNGVPFTIPIFAWYLEGGDTKILVDTGEMAPIQTPEREKRLGAPVLTFDQALGKYGLTPEDIDIVVHTHLHRDHCENDYRCVNAEIFVHEREMEVIRAWHPMDYRYVEDFVDEVEERGQLRLLSMEEGEEREIVPGVRVLHTPIHTEGGLTVLVDTPGGVAAITSFCCIGENFDPPKEIRAMDMEVIPPGTVIAPKKAYDTMIALRDSVAMVLPAHDPGLAPLQTIPAP